jgi:hypothetical protein
MNLPKSTLDKMSDAVASPKRSRRPRLWQYSLAMLFVLMTACSVLAVTSRPYWPAIKDWFFPPIEQQLPPQITVDHCPGCGMG